MDKFNSYIENELAGLPFDLFQILNKFIRLNKEVKVAIVGGYIRDLLIKKIHDQKESAKPTDIDIVIQGKAISLAKFIKKNIKNVELCLIKEFELYNTVEVNINNIKVDIASAREEIYAYPGSNPKVLESDIKNDSRRRDFTINAICFELSKNEIYDNHEGIDHIYKRELHLLHNQSINDDPSRLLRCAKYATRLDFEIAGNSLSQAQNAIQNWPWKPQKNKNRTNYPPGIGIRLRMELSEIFKQDDLSKIIEKLNEWSVISLLNSNIKVNNQFLRGLRWIKKLKGNSILYLLKNSETLELSCERFFINKKEQKVLIDYLYIKNILNTNPNFVLNSPSRLTNFIEENNFDTETIKLIISDGGEFWRPFFKWLFIYKFIKGEKNGDILIKEGWAQGEKLGIEIKRLRYLNIDKHSKN